MFEKLEIAPPDPILGLTEAFKKDSNPNKINLGVGEYKDSNGLTPILDSVKKAEQIILEKEQTKLYLPIDGNPIYNKHVQFLLFGQSSPILHAKRAVTVQTPGGTAALRVGADFLAKHFPNATIWLSDPTWPNHNALFQSANLPIKSYPYYNSESKTLDFDRMLDILKSVPAGDVVLLHGGCHNPTGVDPDREQWIALGETAASQGWIPFVDFAYQGFATGIEEDALGVRELALKVPEIIIASSFSKNFGLYNERVGALTLVGKTEEEVQKALGNLKRCVRTNYSNPPAHGASIVATVLETPELRKEWEGEVAAMRSRIAQMRTLFVETLKKKGVKRDFSFIAKQKGMFSFSGLNVDQVKVLREKYSIYIVGNGRINVAGMTEKNMEPLCTAIAEVLDT